MLTSIIRTVVPMIVGVIVTLAIKLGIPLDDATVTPIVTVLVSTAYYASARVFETRVASKLGWLLGAARQPTYDGKHA